MPCSAISPRPPPAPRPRGHLLPPTIARRPGCVRLARRGDGAGQGGMACLCRRSAIPHDQHPQHRPQRLFLPALRPGDHEPDRRAAPDADVGDPEHPQQREVLRPQMPPRRQRDLAASRQAAARHDAVALGRGFQHLQRLRPCATSRPRTAGWHRCREEARRRWRRGKHGLRPPRPTGSKAAGCRCSRPRCRPLARHSRPPPLQQQAADHPGPAHPRQGRARPHPRAAKSPGLGRCTPRPARPRPAPARCDRQSPSGGFRARG